MKTLQVALGLVAVSLIGIDIVSADPLAPAVEGKKNEGKAVFVTGSRIPQRVTVKAIGTKTTSPVRVYTREEMDRTGKFTTEGILAQDPSVTIIGNGSH
jgi:outer membrane cobalamin receptor